MQGSGYSIVKKADTASESVAAARPYHRRKETK